MLTNPIEILRNRGMIHQVSDESFEAEFLNEMQTGYIGYDPTHESLHLGNYLTIMLLAWLQKCGHRPVVICGGGTGMIGDPSGKSDERNLLDEETIDRNLASQRAQLERLVDFDCGPNSAMVLNNLDWLNSMKVIDFLRDVGKHFRLGTMLSKDSVKSRMDSDAEGISFTEFSYQVMQGYDFLHLYENHGCRVQMGGSDQWGNMTAGMDLIRKKLGGRAFVATCPLLLNSQGQKFGKSEEGAIFLSPEYTSPYKFFQYFMRAADSDIPVMLRWFTFKSLEEIAELEKAHAEAPEKREAHTALAEEVTIRVHGKQACGAAQRATRAMFGGSLEGMDKRTLEDVFEEVPSVELERGRLEEGYPVLDLLTEAGVVPSKKEARRRIEQGGIYLNNEPLSDMQKPVTPDNLLAENILVIRSGKKNYFLARFN